MFVLVHIVYLVPVVLDLIFVYNLVEGWIRVLFDSPSKRGIRTVINYKSFNEQ